MRALAIPGYDKPQLMKELQRQFGNFLHQKALETYKQLWIALPTGRRKASASGLPPYRLPHTRIIPPG